MTCVVGIVKAGTVHIAADSAATNGDELIVRRDAKVFINGPFIIGFTSSYRMGQLLQYAFRPPDQPSGMDDYRYMVTLFIDAVRRCLKAGGFASENNEVEAAGTFLVGFNGRLYTVESDYQVSLTHDNFAAVGSGARVALGALYALQGVELTPPQERLAIALAAAERFTSSVRAPFTFESKHFQWSYRS